MLNYILTKLFQGNWPLMFISWSEQFSLSLHLRTCPCFLEPFDFFAKDIPSNAIFLRTTSSPTDLTIWHADSCGQRNNCTNISFHSALEIKRKDKLSNQEMTLFRTYWPKPMNSLRVITTKKKCQSNLKIKNHNCYWEASLPIGNI